MCWRKKLHTTPDEYLLRWVSSDVLLRLRIVHCCIHDPIAFVAEVKLVDVVDPSHERDKDGFTRVGKFWITVIDVAERSLEIDEEWLSDTYPTFYAHAFFGMAQCWLSVVTSRDSFPSET